MSSDADRRGALRVRATWLLKSPAASSLQPVRVRCVVRAPAEAIQRAVCAASMNLLLGCAQVGLGLVPSPQVTSADYAVFAKAWTGHLPSKQVDSTWYAPSDGRLLALGASTVDQERRAMYAVFSSWCSAQRGRALSSGIEDPGEMICATSAGPGIAAIRIRRDYESVPGGGPQALIQHWHAPAIAEYAAQVRANRERSTARGKALIDGARALATKEDQARQMQVQALAQARAKAAALPTVARCAEFERQSNALRARLGGDVLAVDFTRFVSDLRVPFDECSNARPGPPEDLLAVYRFNLQSFQLAIDAWNDMERLCGHRPGCAPDETPTVSLQKHLASLQSRYPAIHDPPPKQLVEILQRLVRFQIDR